ncbi:transcription elongation factor GreB [Succinimonas amylolytica]|uniref:transcription elongation factor GreB n=1 Tax=Succinimonas amylolytica TaxID=83769 RepID=UPI00035C7DF1
MGIYVTREGLMLIKQEFNDIWTNIRPEVTKKLAWAASLGDRSENADYQYNKRLLREIDIYVKRLSDIIRDAEVLDRSAEGNRSRKVFFGAYVEIENDDGDIKHFRIVGAPEVYGRRGYISLQSPMAKGLLNHEVDDEAVIMTPRGKVSWYINRISYQHEDWFGEEDKPVFQFSSSNEYKEPEIMSDEEIQKARDEYLKLLARQSDSRS